jgi:hypothetical protein
MKLALGRCGTDPETRKRMPATWLAEPPVESYPTARPHGGDQGPSHFHVTSGTASLLQPGSKANRSQRTTPEHGFSLCSVLRAAVKRGGERVSRRE